MKIKIRKPARGKTHAAPDAEESDDQSPTLKQRRIGRKLEKIYHQIEYVSPSRLTPNARNPRTHSAAQIKKLEAIIKRLGFNEPVIVDENGNVISGNARLQAAKNLGLKSIPTVRIDHLTATEKRIYVLAANRIAVDAGWDWEMLAWELHELAIEVEGTELDLSLTGFEISEIDDVVASHSNGGGGAPDDEVPERDDLPISAIGQVWTLGKHRLLVGDARDPASYVRLMRETLARVVVSDPPYNVRISTFARRNSQHREFAMASGEMSEAEFAAFLRTALTQIAAALADGGLAYLFMDWRHSALLERIGREVVGTFKNLCVWVKSNAGMGTFYRSQHELVLIFKKGTASHTNTFELGQHGRSRTNVWRYAGVNAFKSERREELDLHPTVKPVEMIADVLLDCTARGEAVLDPFVGSGTTIIAAEKTGRRAFAMEIDPQYADVAIRRWQAYTGRDAILEATGETFAAVEKRAIDAAAEPLEDVS